MKLLQYMLDRIKKNLEKRQNATSGSDFIDYINEKLANKGQDKIPNPDFEFNFDVFQSYFQVVEGLEINIQKLEDCEETQWLSNRIILNFIDRFDLPVLKQSIADLIDLIKSHDLLGKARKAPSPPVTSPDKAKKSTGFNRPAHWPQELSNAERTRILDSLDKKISEMTQSDLADLIKSRSMLSKEVENKGGRRTAPTQDLLRCLDEKIFLLKKISEISKKRIPERSNDLPPLALAPDALFGQKNTRAVAANSPEFDPAYLDEFFSTDDVTQFVIEKVKKEFIKNKDRSTGSLCVALRNQGLEIVHWDELIPQKIGMKEGDKNALSKVIDELYSQTRKPKPQ